VVLPGGGFCVAAEGRQFSVESSFSVPNRADLILAATSDGAGNLTVEGSRVTLDNQHYQLQRGIQAQLGRVLVRDSFTNLTAQPVGIVFTHRLAVARAAVQQVYLAGGSVSPPLTRPLKTNPTVFASLDKFGIGLVALDDVLIHRGASGRELALVELLSGRG